MTGDRPVRVLAVIGGLWVGGAESYLTRVAPDLRNHGVDIEICALERVGPKLGELEAAGIHVHGTPYPLRTQQSNTLTLLATINSIRRTVAGGRFDVVHTYLYWSDVLGVIGGRLGGCRRIIVSRRALHNWAHSRTAKLHGLEQFANMLANEVIANSETVLKDAEANERFLPATRTVIYNGINVDGYTPSNTSADGPLRLITVGALAPRKGQEYAIEALADLKKAGVEVTLQLVGSGPDEAMLKRKTSDAGLDRVVSFEGEQLDPRPYLACADAFLLPSRQEGFSNAILEAMACALPVIATDVGGNAEAIVDGEGGFIVPPENPSAMAGAIAALAKSRHRVQEMGRYNRTRAADRFSLEASVRKLAGWYVRGAASGRG